MPGLNARGERLRVAPAPVRGRRPCERDRRHPLRATTGPQRVNCRGRNTRHDPTPPPRKRWAVPDEAHREHVRAGASPVIEGEARGLACMGLEQRVREVVELRLCLPARVNSSCQPRRRRRRYCGTPALGRGCPATSPQWPRGSRRPSVPPVLPHRARRRYAARGAGLRPIRCLRRDGSRPSGRSRERKVSG